MMIKIIKVMLSSTKFLNTIIFHLQVVSLPEIPATTAPNVIRFVIIVIIVIIAIFTIIVILIIIFSYHNH